ASRKRRGAGPFNGDTPGAATVGRTLPLRGGGRETLIFAGPLATTEGGSDEPEDKGLLGLHLAVLLPGGVPAVRAAAWAAATISMSSTQGHVKLEQSPTPRELLVQARGRLEAPVPSARQIAVQAGVLRVDLGRLPGPSDGLVWFPVELAGPPRNSGNFGTQ